MPPTRTQGAPPHAGLARRTWKCLATSEALLPRIVEGATMSDHQTAAAVLAVSAMLYSVAAWAVYVIVTALL